MLRVCRRKCPDGKLRRPSAIPGHVCGKYLNVCIFSVCVGGVCVCTRGPRMLKGKQMLPNASLAPSFVGGPARLARANKPSAFVSRRFHNVISSVPGRRRACGT